MLFAFANVKDRSYGTDKNLAKGVVNLKPILYHQYIFKYCICSPLEVERKTTASATKFVCHKLHFPKQIFKLFG